MLLPDILVIGRPTATLNSLSILQRPSQYLTSPLSKYVYVEAPPPCYASCFIDDMKIMHNELIFTEG